MTKRKTKTTETATTPIEGTVLAVTKGDLMPKPVTLSDYVASTRTAFSWLKDSFKQNVVSVAEYLKLAQKQAEKEGVEWSSLFNDPAREDQMPFSMAAATMYLTVASAKLGTYEDMLPADINVRYKLATTPPRMREKVMVEYLRIVSVGETDDGEKVVSKQKAMSKAKVAVGATKPRTKKPKGFNAAAVARKLHKDLGTEGLSELADAIERILEDEGVRE